MGMRCAAVVGSSWGHLVCEAVEGISFACESLDDMRLFLERNPCRYVFFLNYSSIVPSDFVDEHECVNFHCTKLPYGRGGHPIENLILRGYTDTVITAHKMTEEVDAGPIYCFGGFVPLEGTKNQILQRFVEPVTHIVEWMITNEPFPAPQEGEATYFKRMQGAELWEAMWSRGPMKSCACGCGMLSPNGDPVWRHEVAPKILEAVQV